MKAGWKKVRVGDWGQVSGGRQRSPHLRTGKPRPYLRVANVFEDHIDASDVLTMLFSDAEFGRYQLQSGDILLNEGQSIELVGRSAIYEGRPPECAFQNTLVRFRAGPECDHRFAQQVFKQLWRIGVFQGIAKRTTSIAHLGVNRFADLTVIVPPLPAQRAIAQNLGLFDSSVSTINRLIDVKRTFKRGLIQQLLTGKMRFPEFKGRPWRQRSLGDFFVEKSVTNADRVVELVYSCTKSIGIVPQSERFGKRLASADLVRYKVVEPGDLVYDPMLLWDGSIGFVPAPMRGVVSPAYETFSVRGTAYLEYFWPLLKSYNLLHRYKQISQGTNTRRRKAHPKDFLKIVVLMPPTNEEQNRIAAVLTAVQREIDLLVALRMQIEANKKALLSRLLSGEIPVPVSA